MEDTTPPAPIQRMVRDIFIGRRGHPSQGTDSAAAISTHYKPRSAKLGGDVFATAFCCSHSQSWSKSGVNQEESMFHPCIAPKLAICGGILLLATTIAADTLVLRDGRRVQGQLVGFRDGFIDFEDAYSGGRVVRLNRDQVTAIEFDRNGMSQPAYPQTNAYPPSAERRPRGLREKQMMAAANVQWSDTGLDVAAGQNVYFEAVGEIRWGPNRRATPAGEANSPNNPARPMPNRPGAALIGRVGDSQDYFFIGNGSGAIRMRNSGRLFLGINDDNVQDNTGYFRVIIYY
jgi:hypothetical protein